MARNGLREYLVGDLSVPNSSPFAKLLDSCLHSKSAPETRRIHARLIKTPFSSEVFIQNRLIDVYAKCGCLDDACKLFDRMPEKNTFTWNSIINALIKSGFIDEAARSFGLMPNPDQCSWNSMISGFAQHDCFEEALEYFVGMHKENFILTDYSFASALSACAGLTNIKIGAQIHASVSKSPYSCDVYMGSALIDMYSKCSSVASAQKVFDRMSQRNIVSWNSLITCYEQNGPASEALDILVRMMDSGFEPDEVTLASVVSACATLSAVKEGLQIHARLLKFDQFRDDLILGNALVDMYAKCNRVNEARWVFDRMPIRNVVSETSMVSGYAKAASVKAARSMFAKMVERNVISWNALIAGYTQNDENEEALRLFVRLNRESVWPTHYTFGNILNACANLADMQLGRQIHSHVLKHGFQFQSGPEADIFVGNSLIDMYVKCGSIEDGYRVFEKMIAKDWVSWNAMIVGYAQNGYGSKALEIFRKMLVSGEKPDHVTMIGVLCACSHMGLVEEGYHYFLSMSRDHGLVPLKDHYTCMADLLGRAGFLKEAKNLIETMPMQPDAVVWGSLLAACRVYSNIEMGKYAAEKLLEINPENSGPYVLLSNMYAELGRWGDVVRIRKFMRQHGILKQPGYSWIEIQSQVHVFMVKDRSHPQRRELYQLLKILTKHMNRIGYVPDFSDLEAHEEQSDSEFFLCNQMEISAFAAY
ncbi:pentatricopeptide repeat-containing protein At2g13600 [Malania oleifera]|uniref:pentatricopeptide repeat-containing protein At2g13600 n=1 Tax=Malania oleifera TaxID=397392 RepID=UPI0025AE6374|nr:pentatricopeptide repeat-containing protein At2g13600 [Malania oleifera]